MKIIELKNKLGELIIPKKWEPLGTIKMFSCEMDMSKYYYGTWELTLKERSPIGVNPNSTEDRFKTAGQQFGEKEHTLTIFEIPEHNHNTYNGNESGTGDYAIKFVDVASDSKTLSYQMTATNGGGQAHNNIHPVETIYFYKRTA